MRYIRLPLGRIQALESFTLHDGREIAQGTLGGYIDSPRNLAQTGTAWVFPGSEIRGNAYVSDSAIIEPDLELPLPNGIVKDQARVYKYAVVKGGEVTENSRVLDRSFIGSKSLVAGEAVVFGESKILNGGKVLDAARLKGTTRKDGEQILAELIIDGGTVKGNARVSGSPYIAGTVQDNAYISDCPAIDATSVVMDEGRVECCVKLINTVVDQMGIVCNTGEEDNVIEGQTISDAGMVTNCPGRAKSKNQCCRNV